MTLGDRRTMYSHTGQCDHTLFRNKQILVNHSTYRQHVTTNISLRSSFKYSDLHFSYCVRWGDTDTKIYPTTPDETLLSPPGRRTYEMNSPFCRDVKKEESCGMVFASNLKFHAASRIRTYAGRSHLISSQTPKPLSHRNYQSRGPFAGLANTHSRGGSMCFL